MTNATSAVLSEDGQILTVFVPINFRTRGGRKLIIPPAGAPEPVYSPPQPKINPPLVKALARAHRWKKQLDTKQYATIKEIAAAEKVAERYVGQLLKLTLLAPDIVEMILDGRLPKGVGLADFMKPWPGIWEEQRARLQALASGTTETTT